MRDDSTPITLAQAADLFPKRDGRKLHIKTIKRRIVVGCNGVRLNAFKDGGVWFTTPRWIREFQEACTRRAMPGRERPAAQRSRSHEQASEALRRRYGFHGQKEDCRIDAQAKAEMSDVLESLPLSRPLRGLLPGREAGSAPRRVHVGDPGGEAAGAAQPARPAAGRLASEGRESAAADGFPIVKPT